MNSHNVDTIVIDSMYLSLFEGVDMGVYVLDAENRLAFASPAFERVTGLDAGEATGKPASELFSPGGDDADDELFNAAPGGTVRREVAVLHRGNRVPGYVDGYLPGRSMRGRSIRSALSASHRQGLRKRKARSACSP